MLTRDALKVFTSCILIVSLLLLHLQTAYAVTFKGRIEDMRVTEEQVLHRLGITQFAEIVETSQINRDGTDKTKFTIKIESVLTDVVVLEDSATKTVLEMKQDDICNILELRENGDIIVDGNLVKITRTVTEKNIFTNEIMPRAGATIYFDDKLSFGVKDDYSNPVKTENVADIGFQKTIAEIGVALMLTVMSVAMGGIGGTAATFAYGAGYAILDYFLERDSTTKGLSCKSEVYTHKNYKSGYIPQLFTFIYRYDTIYYSRVNYGGTKAPLVTTYKYNMQG